VKGKKHRCREAAKKNVIRGVFEGVFKCREAAQKKFPRVSLTFSVSQAVLHVASLLILQVSGLPFAQCNALFGFPPITSISD